MGTTAKAEVLNKIEIPINGDNYDRPGRPKAPERIPIFCHYEGGQLFFAFSYNFGSVIVNVINDNTGEQWNAILQTSDTANMNVSEDAGSYHIEIITINNKAYQGEYEIQE